MGAPDLRLGKAHFLIESYYILVERVDHVLGLKSRYNRLLKI